MAKPVLVQRYTLDGEVTETRMTMRAWNKKFMELEQCQGDFYVVWWKLKRRWDGSKRRELHSTACAVGFRVEWSEVRRDCHCSVVPVLVPDDE